MARLLLEACTLENADPDNIQRLQVSVSVSVADSGEPVTGLAVQNFRVALVSRGDRGGLAGRNLVLLTAEEKHWQPDDVEPSGCYRLEIGYTSLPWTFIPGFHYVIGIEAQTFTNDVPPQVVDRGQTVIELISAGHL